MSPTLTTFLFEAANFLVLAGALSWLFFKPIRQALANRSADFEADSAQAAEKLATAAAAQQEIDDRRSSLQAELNALRARELEAARGRAEEILADARTAAARELEQSHRQAARMSGTQQDRLAQAAAAAAATSVARLLEQIEGPDLTSALIQSACQQLATLPPADQSPIRVESAAPLAPEQVAALCHACGPVNTDFRTVEGLGAGVRIATGQGLIDASVSGLGRFARQSLLQEMNHLANNHNPLQSANDA